MSAIAFHRMTLLAAGLTLAGCSAAPTAPGPGAARSAPAAVPDFRQVEARHTDGVLHVAARAGASSYGGVAPFDPVREGGWCFQLFLDADQGKSGYGPGFDFLVRAIEVLPGGAVDVRRTEGGSGPGGWGEAVGRVALEVNSGDVEFVVPLAALGGDDGAVDFTLEVYRTIRLPREKGGGVKHEFVANYSGASLPFGGPHAAFVRSLDPVAPTAARPR